MQYSSGIEICQNQPEPIRFDLGEKFSTKQLVYGFTRWKTMVHENPDKQEGFPTKVHSTDSGSLDLSVFHPKNSSRKIYWCDWIILRTSSELLKILPEPFQKDPKATNSKGSCYPVDLASLRAILHHLAGPPSSLAGPPWVLRLSGGGSVPFRSGASPLRSTEPIHLPKGSATHSEPAKLDSGTSQMMQNRTPVCQIDRIPIILRTWENLRAEPTSHTIQLPAYSVAWLIHCSVYGFSFW